MFYVVRAEREADRISRSIWKTKLGGLLKVLSFAGFSIRVQPQQTSLKGAHHEVKFC
jgi:hypothetical protein